MEFSLSKVIFSKVSGAKRFLSSVWIKPVELNKHSLEADVDGIQKIALATCVKKGYNCEFNLKKNNGPNDLLDVFSLGGLKYEFWYKSNSLFKAETDVLIKYGVVLGCTISFILVKNH